MDTLTLPAPGKLNLFLHVNNQRFDAMHELQTIFQLIDLFDIIQFKACRGGEITINKLPQLKVKEENLIYRAAKLMQRQDRKRHGVDIILEKNLPIGGGLGGGSSDAATTLLALNKLWDINLSPHELLHLGLQLGADVPVFLHGKSCWAEGIGELISPMELPGAWYVIIDPRTFVSTAEVFFAKDLPRNTRKVQPNIDLINSGHNDCEIVVLKKYPKIAKLFDELSELADIRLTGTGACLFARFTVKQDAYSFIEKLPAGIKYFFAKGINSSPVLTNLGIDG